jgi:nicotinamidase-related amidase
MKLEPNQTALLTLDFQKVMLGLAPGSENVISEASKAVEFARQRKFHIVHVGLGFSEGHPEIPDNHSRLKRAKDDNLFVKGTPSAELHLILRTRGIENLVLFGISTSGITLSTLRRAFDLDFRCVVLKDACFDADPEVHRVLTEKIFTTQATVVTVDAFIAGQG